MKHLSRTMELDSVYPIREESIGMPGAAYFFCGWYPSLNHDTVVFSRLRDLVKARRQRRGLRKEI